MIGTLIAFAIGIASQFVLPFEILSFEHIDVIVYTLLGIGLYGAVHDIDTKILRENEKMVFLAVTVGVLFKSVFVGGLLYLIYPTPYSFLLGIVVAQIDPLSVAFLNKKRVLSKKGDSILRAWSSFDDPMTVLLVMYIGINFVQDFSGSGVGEYFLNLSYNLFLFVAVYVIYFVFLIGKNNAFKILLLIISFVVGIKFVLMLGIAGIGLYLRPKGIETETQRIVNGAFLASIFILGNGLEIIPGGVMTGICLGILAYGAQILCAQLLTRGMSSKDRWGLSLAQYNGITSIILAIFIELTVAGTTDIIIFAILTINGLYYLAHKIFSKKLH